jgi:hypothetical protein
VREMSMAEMVVFMGVSFRVVVVMYDLSIGRAVVLAAASTFAVMPSSGQATAVALLVGAELPEDGTSIEDRPHAVGVGAAGRTYVLKRVIAVAGAIELAPILRTPERGPVPVAKTIQWAAIWRELE